MIKKRYNTITQTKLQY